MCQDCRSESNLRLDQRFVAESGHGGQQTADADGRFSRTFVNVIADSLVSPRAPPCLLRSIFYRLARYSRYILRCLQSSTIRARSLNM